LALKRITLSPSGWKALTMRSPLVGQFARSGKLV